MIRNTCLTALFTLLLINLCHAAQDIEVRTGAFKNGEEMPARYRGDGENISPPLEWTAVPDGTRAIAVICDDPDAPSGTFTHWIIFNISPVITNIKEGIPSAAVLNDGARFGRNDFKRERYDGPRPPSGIHRYYFRVYALDTYLDLAAGSSGSVVLGAMNGHILAKGEVMGRCKSIRAR